MDQTAYTSLVGSGNVNCGNVTNSHNNIVNVNRVIADESPQMMQWLSPLDPSGRHRDVRTNRLAGVGSWLLETDEFRKWRGREAGACETVLFCYGNPGVGKTYLSSLVIDNLCDEPDGEDIATAMFYCDFRYQQQQTTADIMGAILRQLVVGGGVLEHVQIAFQKAKKKVGGRGLLLPDMVQMLKQVIAKLPRVFVCIDALDECLPKHLPELLESLKDILQVSPRMRIFVTGRPQVETQIRRHFTAAIIVPISPKTRDITRYLERKLEMDTEPDAMSDSLRADILRIIPGRISEIFLLVSLSIDSILAEVTVGEREQKLNELSKGNHVEDAYATTLARIKAQKGSRPRLGMEALMWVSNSERPLQTSELCHALGVKIGSADLDVKTVPTIRTLLGCSLGLITVEEYSDTVRLVHLTLQEYLSDNLNLFQSPHSMIAEVCLTYLNFQCVRELSPTLDLPPSTLPLLGYASCYWGVHTRMQKTEDVSPLALRLLIGFEHHISSRLLLRRYNRDIWRDQGFNHRAGPEGFTGLHGAAYLGILNTVSALLAIKEWDINATDATGRTALVWAAVGGHEDVVKMLLERKDVNPSVAGTGFHRTLLSWAAGHGRTGVVRFLLARGDINPNTADNEYGQTLLWLAVRCGHEGVVKLLLEREDINPNTADTEYGQTPLWLAAADGHEGVVKLLLEREDINPNISSVCGQTPFLVAVQNGHEGVVKLLLEREDIDPKTADTKYGRTPLWWAAKGGHVGAIKLLLERNDINPNAADTLSGQTPLLVAAEDGHERVFEVLLERGDIDPNITDTKFGRTPLGWAARGGHEGVVELLLGREDINPNLADTKYGRTPLWWAAGGGHVGVIKLLLEREGIDPDTADTLSGQTPLLVAAEGGHEGVVKLLLDREDINPNVADTAYGQAALSWAVVGGHEGVVKLLLEREDINPNTKGAEHGLTPLLWAARGEHDGVVKLLLERKDIDPNTTDTKYGRTPLEWAAERGRVGAVKLLLERGDIDPDVPGLSGKTALELAASHGYTGVVELLSKPKPPLPFTLDTDEPPEQPSPEPSDPLQSPSQPIPSTCRPQSEPLPLRVDARPLLGIAIRSFMLVSSFILLFYFLAIISPFLSAILLS